MKDDLAAPTLLLAMPQVLDPFFVRSVVLLMAHGEDGSLGLVINRPADLKVNDVLHDLEIEWRGDPDTPAFVGGPVRPQIGTVLFRGSDAAESLVHPGDTATELVPGLSLTQHLGDLQALAQKPPGGGLRLLLGYAGWSPGQLLEEVLRNDWLTAPLDLDLIFHRRPESVWEEALRSVGVDPNSLPSWTLKSDVAN